MQTAEVGALLASYRPGPAEVAHHAAMLALLDASAPFARHHFEPGHFTASAFVLSPDRSRLMLIFHKKLGLWLQPGGHLEASDDGLLDACRREVAEEVGLERLSLHGAGIFDIDVHGIPAFKHEPAHRHFDVRFAFVSESLEFANSGEVADARWVPLADVATITRDESVLRATEKLLRER